MCMRCSFLAKHVSCCPFGQIVEEDSVHIQPLILCHSEVLWELKVGCQGLVVCITNDIVLVRRKPSSVGSCPWKSIFTLLFECFLNAYWFHVLLLPVILEIFSG